MPRVKYVIGSNMPGYMPDSIPAEANNLTEARQILESEIAASYESMFAPLIPEDTRDQDAYHEALAEARKANGPVEIYYGDWVHWIAFSE